MSNQEKKQSLSDDSLNSSLPTFNGNNTNNEYMNNTLESTSSLSGDALVSSNPHNKGMSTLPELSSNDKALDCAVFAVFFILTGTSSGIGAYFFWNQITGGNFAVALGAGLLFFAATAFLLARDYLKTLSIKHKHQDTDNTQKNCACKLLSSLFTPISCFLSFIGSCGVLFGFAYYLYNKHIGSFNIRQWNGAAWATSGIIGLTVFLYSIFAIWKLTSFWLPEELNKDKDKDKSKKENIHKTNKWVIAPILFPGLNIFVIGVSNYAFFSSPGMLKSNPIWMWAAIGLTTICSTVLLSKGYYFDAEKKLEDIKKPADNPNNEITEENKRWFAPTPVKGALNFLEIVGMATQFIGTYALIFNGPDKSHPIPSALKTPLILAATALLMIACLLKGYNIYLAHKYPTPPEEKHNDLVSSTTTGPSCSPIIMNK